MSFPSDTKLERHVKYSDLHAKAIQKEREKLEQKDIEPVNREDTPANLKRQEEGVHFKLIYSGSKNFWRTGDNLDIHIYLHILPHTIEVITYDLEKSKEFERLYLDYYLLEAAVNDEAIAEAAKKKKKLASNKFAKIPSQAQMIEEAKKSVITTFIVSRLQVIETTGQGKAAKSVAFSGMDITPTILPAPPATLIPVPVMRRRRTNAEDYDVLMSQVASSQAALAEATGRAEKIVNLMFASVSGFENMISRKKKVNSAKVSKWGEKWVWAIQRVILQNAVATCTAQWEAYEEKFKK